ncbi:MFS transporter [Staphylococcus gallinarum]|nr:MFS transporter [Staphylococcus gallinarum]
MTILIMAMPEIVEDLHANAIEQLWMIDIYSLFLAGLIVTMSFIGDKWGRKKILLLGFLIFGVSSVLIVFANNPLHVIIIRALLGIGGAMILPTTLSMIRTIFINAKERATALSIWAGITGIGSVFGPIIAGVLLENFTWKSTFLINIPITIFSFIIGLLILPEYKSNIIKKFDYISSILSITSMICIVWSIKSLSNNGIGNLNTWIIIIGFISLGLFIYRNTRNRDVFLELKLFKNNKFTAGIVTALISVFCMSAILYLVIQWLQLVLGYSPLKAGLFLMPMILGEVLSAIVLPWLSQKIDARLVLVGSLLISSIGFIYLFILSGNLSYINVVPMLFMTGIGTGSLSVASAIIMSNSSIEKASSAGAIEETTYELSSVLGIAILGSLSSTIYKNSLNINDMSFNRLSNLEKFHSNESLVGAIAIANEHGFSYLYNKAINAFTTALIETSFVGGILILTCTLLIIKLLPERISITD